MEISLPQLQSYLFAIEQIPPFTPKRWDLISECVTKLCTSSDKIPQPTIQGPSSGEEGDFCEKLHSPASVKLVVNGGGRPFVPNPKCCQDLFAMLLQGESGYTRKELETHAAEVLYHEEGIRSLKPIVLLPPIHDCCSSPLKFDPRPSCPLIYTTSGTSVGAVFHGKCRKCGRSYYYSYWEMRDGEGATQRYYYDPISNPQEYFQYSSSSLFEVRYLNDITNNIVFSAVTFQSRAEVYYSNNRVRDKSYLQYMEKFKCSKTQEWSPSAKRIEECWFLWCIVNIYSELNVLSTTNLYAEYTSNGKRRNIEMLCEELCNILNTMPNKWALHRCTVKGCAEGYVTIDGNEKLRRPICAAPKSRVQLRPDLPTVVQCCTNYPVHGSKSQTASRYCELHAEDDVSGSDTVILAPSQGSLDVTYTGSLPENDDDSLLVGCKRPENRTKFYDTTAGMLALIRPCGIVVAMCEMYTCESVTQVFFLFLLKTFALNVDTMLRLKYLGYDRACDLYPFLVNQRKRGSAGANILLDNVKFLVDSFHCNKHMEATCMPPNNPLCQFHPKLETFKEIHGVNTESCEQGFRRLNKYKFITRYMGQHKRILFFYYINDKYNKYLEQSLKLV